VTVTAPANGATVSATVTVKADASDNVGVAGVQFKLDGADLGTEDTAAPYAVDWSTTGAANGSHTLSAVARDAAGNHGTAANVTVTVNNPAPPPPTGLAAGYRFGEGTGTTTADAATNGNTGTLVNGPTWTTAGKFGTGISFDGVDDNVRIADSASLHLAATGTIEAYVSLRTLNRWNSVLAKGNTNSDPSHNFALEVTNANRWVCILGSGAARIALQSTTAPVANRFYHVACTWDGTTVRLYVDGVQNASVAQSITPAANTSPLYIGQFGGNADRLAGVIDEVRIYGRALSVGEIQTDMNTPV
jgi:hypothetical protein